MSEKSRDHHGRWRSVTVSFRASRSEVRALDEAVALSGLTKQDYIINRLLNRDVVVIGNPRVFIKLKNKMDEIYKELVRIDSSDEINEELLETINLVSAIYSGATKQTENKGE